MRNYLLLAAIIAFSVGATGAFAQQNGETKKAAGAGMTAVTEAPVSAAARSEATSLYQSGRTALEGGDLNSAIRDLEAAVQLRPEFDSAWSTLAVAYSRAGRDHESRAAFEKSQGLTVRRAVRGSGHGSGSAGAGSDSWSWNSSFDYRSMVDDLNASRLPGRPRPAPSADERVGPLLARPRTMVRPLTLPRPCYAADLPDGSVYVGNKPLAPAHAVSQQLIDRPGYGFQVIVVDQAP